MFYFFQFFFFFFFFYLGNLRAANASIQAVTASTALVLRGGARGSRKTVSVKALKILILFPYTTTRSAHRPTRSAETYRSVSVARLWFVRLLVQMKGNTENTWQSLSHATLSTVIRLFSLICSCLLLFHLLQSVITATWLTCMNNYKDKTLSHQFQMGSEDPGQLPCLQGFSRPQARVFQSR